MVESLVNPLQALQGEMRACRRCLEAGHAIQPGAIFSGGPGARVMVIGQAPGVTEVAAGRPFNAGSGRRLFHWLGQAGWDEASFRASQYMTAVTKCYPGKQPGSKGDRVPSRGEQAFCRPFLEQEIALVQPLLLIPVGGLAISLFFPARLRLNQVVGTATYLPPHRVGRPFPARGGVLEPLRQLPAEMPASGRWIVPLPHPSGASLWPNRPANQALIARAIALLAGLRRAYTL